MRTLLFVSLCFAANASAFQLLIQPTPAAPLIIESDYATQTQFRVHLTGDQIFNVYGFHMVITAPDGTRIVRDQIFSSVTEVMPNTTYTSEMLTLNDLPFSKPSHYKIMILPLGWVGTEAVAEGPITVTTTLQTE